MQQSGDAPTPLPGGYKVGEKVFYTGASYTFADGDKLVHGQQGEVTGAATGEDSGKLVIVQFPGNPSANPCWLTTVRRLRAPPPLPSPACAPHTRESAHAP